VACAQPHQQPHHIRGGPTDEGQNCPSFVLSGLATLQRACGDGRVGVAWRKGEANVHQTQPVSHRGRSS
jgi:hypothetical protein